MLVWIRVTTTTTPLSFPFSFLFLLGRTLKGTEEPTCLYLLSSGIYQNTKQKRQTTWQIPFVLPDESEIVNISKLEIANVSKLGGGGEWQVFSSIRYNKNASIWKSQEVICCYKQRVKWARYVLGISKKECTTPFYCFQQNWPISATYPVIVEMSGPSRHNFSREKNQNSQYYFSKKNSTSVFEIYRTIILPSFSCFS